jgi:DNA repair photolyase
MVGLGSFKIPVMCKVRNYAPYGIRMTFQPYWRCTHGCPTCYAPYGYRWQFWGAKGEVVAVNLIQVYNDYLKLRPGTQVEAAPSCDAFDLVFEKKYEITKNACKDIFSLRSDIPFTFITKSALIGSYVDVLPKLSVPQITIESQRPNISSPNASPYTERLDAVEILTNAGFKVGVRIDPIIPDWTKSNEIYSIINDVVKRGCKHITISIVKLYAEQINKVEKAFGINTTGKIYLKWGLYYYNDDTRRVIEQMVKDKCNSMGITFATCMENLIDDTGNCDPFHLLK